MVRSIGGVNNRNNNGYTDDNDDNDGNDYTDDHDDILTKEELLRLKNLFNNLKDNGSNRNNDELTKKR